ncbi:MAG: hypothetical protein JW860_15220 [Sedimentisphaerales bacterium]|nr:hypothetical protein [Sedimentisphaerales bacterium]
MNLKIVLIWMSALMLITASSCRKEPIVIADLSQTPVGHFASLELAKHLSAVYPDVLFQVDSCSGKGRILFLLNHQVPETGLELGELPVADESFTIVEQNETLWIVAPDERGLLNATYALLEEQGYGFFISGDKCPDPRQWNGFKDWAISDQPLIMDRFVLNWHNFLSGCTGWNYEDWCFYIDQINKMRYNGIMLHFYGNNPAFSFEYLGERKKTGYLNNTASGRDWGNQHVNDVRRLTGGAVFDTPVFGALASQVPEQEKEQAATLLMQRVFDYAKSRRTKIILALDLDTWMAHPGNIVGKLPREALFELKGALTPNPEHPEGFRYYEQILVSLLAKYPQIDQLAVWHRPPTLKTGLGSIWMNFSEEQFPIFWKKEYRQIMQQHPELDHSIMSTSVFAYGKLIAAIQKARDKVNPQLEISSGSWRFDYLPLADVFYPQGLPLIPLDWSIVFDQKQTQELIARVGRNRPVYPVVWAHHDDHRYIGRPYTPWANFSELLTNSRSQGFGLIHWTTRPLDLYFTSLTRQVWQNTQNEPLKNTVDWYVSKWVGNDHDTLSHYLYQWINSGPMFGRETSDHFVDIGQQEHGDELERWADMEAKAQERLRLLETSNESSKNPFIRYQRDMELFYLSFFKNQQLFQEAVKAVNNGNMEHAKAVMAVTNPDSTLMLYVKAIENIGFTSGEKALLFSMNTRWKADYLNMKQRLGLLPVLLQFSPTQHDTLAQAPGRYTYHIDEDGNWWRCLWKQEMKDSQFLQETDRSALLVDDQIELELTSMHGQPLASGTYELKVDYKAESPFKIWVMEEQNCLSVKVCLGNLKQASLRFNTTNEKVKLVIETEQPVKIFNLVLIPKYAGI